MYTHTSIHIYITRGYMQYIQSYPLNNSLHPTRQTLLTIMIHTHEINIAHLIKIPPKPCPAQNSNALGSLGKWSRALKLSQQHARSRPSLLGAPEGGFAKHKYAKLLYLYKRAREFRQSSC